MYYILGSIRLSSEMASMKTSFQAGVDTIYNKMVSCGETPSSKSPTDIANKIQQMYDGRYSTGYSIGYNEGRTQGQNDVKGNPNNYGLYSKNQYDQNYNNGYNAGFNAGQQAAAVSFTQTRASQISFYNPGYHYFDISASESGYDYLIVSGWFSGRITSVEVSNSATKVLASKILSTGDGTNTMVHCILQKPANSCRVKFNHSGSGNGYVIVYGAK